MTNIHDTAVVEEGAEIGDGVKIGPYTIVSDQAQIDRKTEIGPHVVIEGDVRIGERNEIRNGAVIGTPPQDLSFEGGETGVRIGDDNIIREYVTINRSSTSPGGNTVIGNDNMLMSYCHIAHDCQLGNGIAMANGVTLAGHVMVEDQVMMGGLTPVHQFVRIGEYSMVGGISRINKDVPPYVRVSGNPAKVFDLNSVGLRRHDFDADTRKILKRAFKLIYRADNNTSQALDQIESELPSHENIDHLVDFIRQSERGIHK